MNTGVKFQKQKLNKNQMKKLLIVLPLLMVGCKKKEVTPEPTTCNCYKTTYTIGAGGNYYYSSQTSPFVDLCAKNGTIEYQWTGVYKIVWTCN